MAKRYIDISGRVFGELTVIDFSHVDIHRDSFFSCKCSCGKTALARANFLKSGRIKTCNTQWHYYSALLAGNPYGRLTVTSLVSGDGPMLVNVVCVCGSILIVKAHSLKSGKTQSCGCLMLERIRVAQTTHGLTHTKAYKRTLATKYYGLRSVLDSGWTGDMEKAFWEYFGSNCCNCGATDRIEVDHFIPLSKGGGMLPGNVSPLCRVCNSIKYNKLPIDLPSTWYSRQLLSVRRFLNYWENLSIIVICPS